jgi:hypothetical protein
MSLTADNQPMRFRKEQIEDFVNRMREASSFTMEDGTLHYEENIEMILEEVLAHEADLSQARVAIEQYVISSLYKSPDDALMMRISDAIRAPIDDVIAIEVKMYGHPKFIVSKNGDNGKAYRLDTATETPIHSIKLPTDVAEEVAKYNFTTVQEVEAEVPEIELNNEEAIMEYRVSFFNPLLTGVEDKEALTEDKEKMRDKESEWAENFKKEPAYELIDRTLYCLNYHDQLGHGHLADLNILCKTYFYEEECSPLFVFDDDLDTYIDAVEVPEEEVPPGQYITTAREASLRCFFTAMELAYRKRDEFNNFLLKKAPSVEKTEDGEVAATTEFAHLVTRTDLDNSIAALLRLAARHPFDWAAGDENLKESFKNVFEFVNEDLQKHFYMIMGDFADYFSEREFYQSADFCYELKVMLSDILPDEKAKDEPVEQSQTASPSDSKPSLLDDSDMIL